jgi:hypothetical protein
MANATIQRVVLDDHTGMLTHIMSFLSRTDKITQMNVVSKGFQQSVAHPTSWRTIEVSTPFYFNAFPITEDSAISTVIYRGAQPKQRFTSVIPAHIRAIKGIRHFISSTEATDLASIAATWPKLETLSVSTHSGPTPDELKTAVNTLVSMEHLRNLELSTLNLTQQIGDWPNFRTIEQFNGHLVECIADAIVSHGENLQYLTLKFRLSADTTAWMDAVMASRGRHLVLLHLPTRRYAEQERRNYENQVIGSIAAHSGRLKALRIMAAEANDGNVDGLIDVVNANRYTLRALSVDIDNPYSACATHVAVEQLLETIDALCEGRLEYIHLTIRTIGHPRESQEYPMLSSEVVRRFRYTEIMCNRSNLVQKKDRVEMHYRYRYEPIVMKMYADGLSLYPART